MSENFNEKDKIKAMIFDMDGTVVDSNKLDFEAWKHVFEQHEVALEYKDYIKLLGATSEEIILKYLDINEDEIEEFINKREALFKKYVNEKGLQPMPHIKGLLDQIKNAKIKMALATGAQREKLDFMLEKINLANYFDEIVTADDVEKGKPNAETFLKAAEKLQVSPDETIIWEDAEKGVEAAKNGNLKCIAITTTNEGKEGLEKADLLIDSYKDIDLDDILKHFNS
ncbi:MAG: HAD family phosphatase [Bacteroidota bacterium]|nr:HAD family phosphatase [Bacteroidota bacterium]